MHDLTIENRNQFMRNYLQPNFSQDLANRVDEIDKALLKFNEKSFRLVKQWLKKKSTNFFQIFASKKILLETLKLTKLRIRLGLAFGPGDFHSKEFHLIIKQAKKIINSWEGELIFVYIPANQRKIENMFSRKGWAIRKERLWKLLMI